MGWRAALTRALIRLSGDDRACWCGDFHDPRDHYPTPDETDRLGGLTDRED